MIQFENVKIGNRIYTVTSEGHVYKKENSDDRD